MAIEKDYDVLERLGEGAFGKVYKARHKKTEELVAVKQIKLGAKSWDEACKSTELAALRQLRHPFIVRLKELLRNQLDGSLYYIFEYIDSDLCRLVRQNPSGLDETFAAGLARQLFAGLAHIHQHNFFHRDIKPENVLYETKREVVRIADFGESRSLRARPPFTDYVGTRWYRAPECLLRDRGYSSPVDVWSSGLVFAELLRGSPVFMGSSSMDQLYKIFSVLGQPISDWPEFTRLAEACRFRVPSSSGAGLQSVIPRASSRAIAVLSEILLLNPRRRPMARKVLEHGFFSILPPMDLDRLDTSRSTGGNSAAALSAAFLSERCDSRHSFQMNEAPPTGSGTAQASRPETPVLPPPAPAPPPSRPKSEVCVDDVDLDAELDKILGDAPHRHEDPEVIDPQDFALRAAGSNDSFVLEPEASPVPVSTERERAGFPDIPPLHMGSASMANSRAASPDSRGDIMDALLNDLNDLGVGDDLAPSSARLSQSLAPPAPYSIGLDVETSASTWSPEECMELRRLVKRVVRSGTSDKEQIWLQVSREMGGRYSARECKLQYARDYKADKMRKQASGQNRMLASLDRVPFCLLLPGPRQWQSGRLQNLRPFFSDLLANPVWLAQRLHRQSSNASDTAQATRIHWFASESAKTLCQVRQLLQKTELLSQLARLCLYRTWPEFSI
ncbi:Mak [Symbiodinium sp. CCMP2592]|nr:Mak [Symbiodinium sp. CCMP2592]